MNIEKIINENEFTTLFQSIIDFNSSKVIGYEAFSKIEGYEIQSLFKQAISENLLFLLEKKCQKSAIKNSWALGLKSLLFINVNNRINNDSKYNKDYIKTKLKKYSVHKEHICLQFIFDDIGKFSEITETISLFSEDFKIAIKLRNYSQQAVDMAISLKPAILKVECLQNNQERIQYLSQFCKASHTLLISEKIEHIDALNDALEFGINAGQGYFISRPEIFYPKCSPKSFSIISKFINSKQKHKKSGNSLTENSSEYRRPVSDILTYGKTMLEEESVLTALKYFHNNSDCSIITILNEKEKIKGIIPRTYLLDLLSGQYGFGLHSKKKVSDVMKKDFLIVDENEAVENVVSAATSRDREQIYSPVVIASKNTYKGIVTIKDLMESIIAIEVTGRTLEISQKNRLLEQQQKMIKRDLKMAEHVQRNFYPSKVPELDKWEIAYEFKPLASVSGDVYDFYHSGKILNGISLFDVSGHGIASALVGILAKSIAQKTFEEQRDKPLSEIMASINDSIIKEKGSVENYMTGVILRIENNKVEYINAGHTDVLVKNKTTYILGGNEQRARNRFLGIPDLPVEFNSLTIDIFPDTYFLVYSDCLTESRNSAGEEFGVDRLKQVFNTSEKTTAKEILQDVLKTFYSFTDSVPVRDDLTIVVLKYK